jgi:broad specificity phosphatase PhoE
MHEAQTTLRLLVVRHGETVANADGRYMGQGDSDLTLRGRDQIRAVSERLARLPIDIILASDLPRAARTAEAIGAASGLSVRLDERLRERDVGILQGLTDAEGRARHPDVFRELDSLRVDYAIPGGESAKDVRTRLASLVDDLLEGAEGAYALAVAHGGVARGLLWHLLDVPFRASRWARCDNTSVSGFVCKHGAWVLERWNDTAHLDSDLAC